MRKLLISGRPSNFTDVDPQGQSDWVARFNLKEYAYINGEYLVLEHVVYVRKPVAAFAKRQCEGGFSVVVETTEFYTRKGDDGKPLAHSFFIVSDRLFSV